MCTDLQDFKTVLAFVIERKVRSNVDYNSKENCEIQVVFIADLIKSVK